MGRILPFTAHWVLRFFSSNHVARPPVTANGAGQVGNLRPGKDLGNSHLAVISLPIEVERKEARSTVLELAYRASNPFHLDEQSATR